MIFVDTSAIVALLTKEPEADRLAARLEASETRVTAPHVRLESVMVLATRLGIDPLAVAPAFDAFLAEADITVLPIDDDMARIAVEAFARYGKGRGSRAQLNFGDCLSYAAAKKAGCPVLFVGDDFGHTDLPAA